MEKSIEQIKSTEKETLATFQEEIPSQYFSHLDDEEFKSYTKRQFFIEIYSSSPKRCLRTKNL